MTTKPKPQKDRTAVRDYWADYLTENIDRIRARVESALFDSEKKGYSYCPKCRGTVPVPTPDFRAMTDAIKAVHELAGKKPRPDAEEGGTLVFQRTVVSPDGNV
jgi:hypothetical protein